MVEFLLRGLIPESPHFYCPNLGAGKKNICSNGREGSKGSREEGKGKRGGEEGKRGREARKGQREEGKGGDAVDF